MIEARAACKVGRHGALLALLMCGLTVPPLSAEEPADTTEDAEGVPLWEWRLATFTRYGPSYPASEETQFNFLPLPFPVYRGKYLRLGDDTDKPIQGRIFRTEKIRLNIDFDLTFGADSEDIDARTGMPDLDFLVEAGPELIVPFVGSIRGGETFLALQLRGAVSFDSLDPTWRGLVFNPELRWEKKLGKPNQLIKFRITPAFASKDYMEYFYGVDPAFATPERPAYDASSGYLGTDFTLSMRQPINDKFEIWGGIRLGYYGGAKNEDSPLFTDKTTATVYGAFMYKFWESKKLVPAD